MEFYWIQKLIWFLMGHQNFAADDIFQNLCLPKETK